jgi:glycosyltransferase involved in cell wall biosynthesis
MQVVVSPESSVDGMSAPFCLAVIIPAYNEQESIECAINGVRAITPKIEALGGALKIIVINDGSSDDTGSRAIKAGADHVLTHRANRGLGASVRRGLAEAVLINANIAVKLDADLQHDPSDIPSIIAPILRDEADIVFGHRHTKIDYKMPLVRRWGNRFFNWTMSRLTGWNVVDGQPGLLAVNKAYLSVFYLPGSYNYAQQILLDARYNDMRFTQVDVAFRQRASGTSFVSLKYPFMAIYQILVIIATYAPLRVFGIFGIGALALAALVVFAEMVIFFAGITERPVDHPNLVLGLLFLGWQGLLFSILAELTRRRER